MFHRWISTDSDTEDQCLGCGTVAPHHGSPDSVVVDYSPLPLDCPGSSGGAGAFPHYFTDARDGIECAFCCTLITDETYPVDVEWLCPELSA